MRAALIQMNGSDDPAENLTAVCRALAVAAQGGAEFALTPEVTNCISTSRHRQGEVLHPECSDPTLAALREEAARLGLWLLIGSLAVKSDDSSGRFANRSLLIGPDGAVAARYDKIHMFDVDISAQERFRESEGYRPGTRAVVARTPFAVLGLSICYDLRFAALYRSLAQAGAQVLTVPAAFSPTTGVAHWRPLLQARAIETGCYVLAPAQCGAHRASRGGARSSHGHSLVVSPWGEVLADGGKNPGVIYADLDMAEVEKARARVPSLSHDRPFTPPTIPST
ncbi:putative amidohydrolase [Rhodovulum imhoffii]|uniref:Putative amidohydrolase n=1 Tax=Rhodovulum imhoffii TaxID=365340 RepID=A0A2T5BP80_9RHOB|nr:carbon-nitrogen hydrolase family protein [Rhodovulum imhoffii]MBK5933988.1 amidohydrolase [Rhodovulum imhoffii]PTN00821.1 putative amidohydrolase [Rhodovulum imhoffii]